MASQIEGGGTSLAASGELIQWLKQNKLENQQLIALLTDEEIESVDDLMVFRNSLGDDQKFTEILVSKGVKIGKISKLLKALNNYSPQAAVQNNTDNQNQSSGSILMLDKQEKEAIQLLSSKLFEIESKLKSVPEYSKKLSSSKESVKQKINSMCNEWIKLIDDHKQSLYKWIENIEQSELEKNKVLNKKLNDELHLVQETKSKCQNLMSFASIEDIWTPKQSNKNQQPSQETVVSLVTTCVDKLDKSLKIPEKNAFEQLKFTQFDKTQTQALLAQNINVSLQNKSTLLVDVNNKEQTVQFTVQIQNELDLYSSRELFVKVGDNKPNDEADDEADDEKKDDMDGITKLSIVDNKCSITVNELDNKLGKHKDYSAYIIECLGKIAMRRNEVEFKISRDEWTKFRFDTTDTNHAKIIENGTRIQSLGKACPYVGVSSSTGWNQGKHIWKIKSNGSGPTYNAVGVMTNYSTATKPDQPIYKAPAQSLCYYESSVMKKGGSICKPSPPSGWSTGDTIKVMLDCDEWKVTFHKNDELVGTYNLEQKNQTYYPCMQMCGCKGHDYKLLFE